MLKTQNTAVMKWLYVFAFVVAFLVVFGGFVRLTRSGLSIVEWNPISGAMPPSGQQAWEEEFAKYQETPEYKLINTGMSLPEYKFIFYMEWIHRNIARLAGLFYAFPVFYFLFKKTIPFKEFGIYFVMGSDLVASFQTHRVLFCHPHHSGFVRRVYGWPQSGARFRYLAVDAWQINSA